MSMKCVVCSVTHENQVQKIILFPGIAVEELTMLIQSLFQLDCAAIGFKGKDGLVVPMSLACLSPEVLHSQLTLVLPPNAPNSLALIPFRSTSTPNRTSPSVLSTKSPAVITTTKSPFIAPSSDNKADESIDDTLDQVLRFITGLRTRKIITRDESLLLEEYLFEDTNLIPSAYAVALSANDAEYFAEICKDLADNLKSEEGRIMCNAQEDVLDICERLFEQDAISENQSLYLKHLVLIRDEVIASIYDDYQVHKDTRRMMESILDHVNSDEAGDNGFYDNDDNDEDDDDDDEDENTNAAQASHVSPSLLNVTETLNSVLLDMLRGNEISQREGAELNRMIREDNEYVAAAYELYETDGDYDELKDTLLRCARLEVRKKLMGAQEKAIESQHQQMDDEADDDDEEQGNDEDYDEEEQENDEESSSRLTPNDLVAVDLAALLESLGVTRTWSSSVPHEFTIAVFAFAHTRVLLPSQASALCELYDADYDVIKGAWEVYCVQHDLDDFIDTMLRIVRDINLEDVAALKSQQRDSNSAHAAYQVQEATYEANTAVKNAKLDLLKHSLEMMVKQSMLSAQQGAEVYERALHGDSLLDAAIESYAKDRDVSEFLETLQILGTHTTSEINAILDTKEDNDSHEEPSTHQRATTIDTTNETEDSIMTTLKSVISQLSKDNFLDEDSTGVLLSLIESGDERVFSVFQKFSSSKDWVELLNDLSYLASEASDSVHTPENPAYDYVDDSRDDEEEDEDDDDEEENDEGDDYDDDDEEEGGADEDDDDVELDPLDDLPAPPVPVSRVTPPAPPSTTTTAAGGRPAGMTSYAARDMKEVLGVLQNAGALTRERFEVLERLADVEDRRLNDAFLTYRVGKDIHVLLKTLETLVENSSSTPTAQAATDRQQAHDDADVQGAFLRVVQNMSLSNLETAALRLSIARNDASIKEALDEFRTNRDEEVLQVGLRAIARKTITETLDESDYTMQDDSEESESLMGSTAARAQIFPLLISELVKEKIIEDSAGTKLMGYFSHGNKDIKTALDSYDANRDMAQLVTSLKHISVKG